MYPPMEQRGLRPFHAPQPPHSVDHAIHEKLLDRSHRRKVCSNLVTKVLEGVRVLLRENDVTGKEPVLDRVETNDGFSIRRLWSRGVESVRPISGSLSFTRHGLQLPLISSRLDGPADLLLESVTAKQQKTRSPLDALLGL